MKNKSTKFEGFMCLKDLKNTEKLREGHQGNDKRKRKWKNRIKKTVIEKNEML